MDFNPFDPAFRADPYPVYAQLREGGPVQPSAMNFWPVSSYDDVSFVLKNHALFSSSAMGVGAVGGTIGGTRSIISSDPPDHTHLRNLVNRAFTPRMVAEMEPRIREITRELHRPRRTDRPAWIIVDDLAMPLPVTVIAEILGVEPIAPRRLQALVERDVGNTTGPPSDERTQRHRRVPALLRRRRRRCAAATRRTISSARWSRAGGGRRHADQRRDHLVRHAAADRRQRDDDEPHRQRDAGARRASRQLRKVDRRPGAASRT